MKILFYDTQTYDKESFSKEAGNYPGVEMDFLKSTLAPQTAPLAQGYDAVCAFVNSDVGTGTVEALHKAIEKCVPARKAHLKDANLKAIAMGMDL